MQPGHTNDTSIDLLALPDELWLDTTLPLECCTDGGSNGGAQTGLQWVQLMSRQQQFTETQGARRKAQPSVLPLALSIVSGCASAPTKRWSPASPASCSAADLRSSWARLGECRMCSRFWTSCGGSGRQGGSVQCSPHQLRSASHQLRSAGNALLAGLPKDKQPTFRHQPPNHSRVQHILFAIRTSSKTQNITLDTAVRAAPASPPPAYRRPWPPP